MFRKFIMIIFVFITMNIGGCNQNDKEMVELETTEISLKIESEQQKPEKEIFEDTSEDSIKDEETKHVVIETTLEDDKVEETMIQSIPKETADEESDYLPYQKIKSDIQYIN